MASVSERTSCGTACNGVALAWCQKTYWQRGSRMLHPATKQCQPRMVIRRQLRTLLCRNSCCCSTGTPSLAATAFLTSSNVCSYFTLLAVKCRIWDQEVHF